MRIDVLTLFPDMILQAQVGVVGRALERSQFSLHCFDLRAAGVGLHRRVDDRTYGGGPGMVMMIDPLVQTLADAQRADPSPTRVIMLSPSGRPFDQRKARELAGLPRITLVCGRYEGIDQRFVDHYVDDDISLGDFVLSGGEIAALAIIDALVRLLPGVLGHAQSSTQDSFEDGLLDCPHYTRPPSHALGDVPAILQSGDHAAIGRWRRAQQLRRTQRLRPDLLDQAVLSDADRAVLKQLQSED